MKENLEKLIKNSYTPYIDYKVAAAVEMTNGDVVYGVNVQLPTMGGSICAERNAIYSAITQGYKKSDFNKLYVYVEQEEPVFPCFLCRQTILEFFSLEKTLVIMNKTTEKQYELKEILPYPFGGDNL